MYLIAFDKRLIIIYLNRFGSVIIAFGNEEGISIIIARPLDSAWNVKISVHELNNSLMFTISLLI